MNLTKEYLDFKIPCIQGHFRESKQLGEHKVSIHVRACCDLTCGWKAVQEVWLSLIKRAE